MERIVKQIVIHIHLDGVFNMCNLIKIRLTNVIVKTFSRQRNGLNNYNLRLWKTSKMKYNNKTIYNFHVNYFDN